MAFGFDEIFTRVNLIALVPGVLCDARICFCFFLYPRISVQKERGTVSKKPKAPARVRHTFKLRFLQVVLRKVTESGHYLVGIRGEVNFWLPRRIQVASS